VSGLETAIRSALERSDRTKAEVRARIYQSARQALESGLRKQGVNDPETVAEQRHRLEATIHAIEQEERESIKTSATVAAPINVSPPPVPEPSRVPEPPRVQEPPPEQAPLPVPQVGAPRAAAAQRHAADDSALSFGVDRDHAADTAMAFDDVRAVRDDQPTFNDAAVDAQGEGPSFSEAKAKKPVSRADKKRAKVAAAPRRGRGFFSRLFVFVVILSSICIAAWWVYSTGLLLSDSQRQTGVPPQQPTASADDFSGDSQEPKTIDPQHGFSSAWLDVFKRGDQPKVTAGSNATVEMVGASDGQAVRIVSHSSDADGAVAIAISTDILRQMVGKTSTIAFTVQSSGEKPVQFAVSCALDRLGGCSRHRFTANPERSDLLFRVTLPDSVTPNAPGQFFINADMNGKGDGINIYSIRVLPGQ
jgi:hypothetical protein